VEIREKIDQSLAHPATIEAPLRISKSPSFCISLEITEAKLCNFSIDKSF
jgi:hypothetical protein